MYWFVSWSDVPRLKMRPKNDCLLFDDVEELGLELGFWLLLALRR
jgi:hypothetical protein